MNLPRTYKGILKLLIKIAENGNPYYGKLDYDEQLLVGSIIAGIQNDLSEMTALLEKFNLKYHG